MKFSKGKKVRIAIKSSIGYPKGTLGTILGEGDKDFDEYGPGSFDYLAAFKGEHMKPRLYRVYETEIEEA